MVNLLKVLLNPFKRLLNSPSIRYSNHFKGIQYNPRETMLDLAMRFARASRVSGAYMEFGVYRGETFAAAFFINKYNGPRDMSFYAFDSFQGLPKIKGKDALFAQYEEGQYQNSLGNFKELLNSKGVNLQKVRVIPGWFSDSLSSKEVQKEVSEKAAIAWVDCDLYESAVDVLNFLTERVSSGTILIFDDWFSFRGDPEKGEQQAFAEWLQKNPHITASQFHKFGWHGNSFILHLKPSIR